MFRVPTWLTHWPPMPRSADSSRQAPLTPEERRNIARKGAAARWAPEHTMNAAADGIEEAVAWHTVGIVSNNGRNIGAGAAVSWRGRPFILTADHVLSDHEPRNDLWFFFRVGRTLERAEREELHRRPMLEVAER